MIVEPAAPRFAVETTAEGLRVVMPARKHWFVLGFLSLWLMGWAFGEVSAIRELLSPTAKTQHAFLIFWLAGWTVGGAFAFLAVAWQIAGREVLKVGRLGIEHRFEVLGIGRSRGYRLSDVTNLRAVDRPGTAFANQGALLPPVSGGGSGALAFDYGARTIRIGAGLDEAEARLLLTHLQPRLPRPPGTF